jgi:protein-tyrosine-phosphatase
MAEAILRQSAQGRWRAGSAGDAPVGRAVHPVALQTLRDHGVETRGLRPRLWGEFFGLGREPVRILITLADVEAARVSWELDNSKLARGAWPMPDPGDTAGSEAEVQQAFEAAFACLARRIGRLLALHAEQLAPADLASALDEIARQT